MTRTVGPVWIVQPTSAEEMPHPEHPIVLPPDTPPDSGLTPEHPIVIPDPGTPVDPNAPEVSHPIVLPGDPSWGDDLKPTHPIVLPNPPDGGGSTEPVGAPTFYQRKTLGINWDSSFDSSAVVDIKAGDSDTDPITVRTVANDGTSSVTYPQDFTGQVTIQVVGKDGYLEATTTIN